MNEVMRKTKAKSNELDMLPLNGNISNVIKHLEKMKDRFGENATMHFYPEYQYYDDYDVACEIKYNELETLEEAQLRTEKSNKRSVANIKAAATRKMNKELKEREEFERLRAKFEK